GGDEQRPEDHAAFDVKTVRDKRNAVGRHGGPPCLKKMSERWVRCASWGVVRPPGTLSALNIEHLF
ncbi:MAG: hypothetical protein R6U57_12475, partial [Anaerolineales bacterium]